MSGTGPGADDRFRPDLEGLRAVAVVAVLAYHAGVPGFRGGYVGVDVFFVLSGFLITGLLVRELAVTGRVALPSFYARRARRLLPAAALVLLVTSVFALVLLPPLAVPSVAVDIAAAAGYASNLRFAAQATDYLAAEVSPSPVLHFWSLGVEEQFYLFWPALLALASGAAFAAGDRARGIRRVSLALVVALVGSLALGAWLTGARQPWAFFLLPARAWELALGGLLALPWAVRLVPVRLAPWLGWTGLALIVWSAMAFSASTPFPGVAALVPTLGSALVIASGLPPRSPGPAGDAGAGPRQDGAMGGVPRQVPTPGTVLSAPFVRYVGRISYSLYLWHWPVLVLGAIALGGDVAWPVRVALAGVAALLAAGTHRWVEDPLRHGRLIGVRPARVLAAAAIVTVVTVGVGLGVGSLAAARLGPAGPAAGDEDVLLALPTAGPELGATPGATTGPIQPPGLPRLVSAPVPVDLVPTLRAALDDLPIIYADGCHRAPAETDSPDCVYGDPGASTVVVLYGDSHAASWFPTLERLATERGWRLVSLTKSACPFVRIPVWSSIFNRAYRECATWQEAVIRRIQQERPHLVVVAYSRVGSLAVEDAPVRYADGRDAWTAALGDSLARLRAVSRGVVLIGDTPRMATDPPVCLSEHLDDAAACATAGAKAIDPDWTRLDAEAAVRAGVAFIDPSRWLCTTEPCGVTLGRVLIYRDAHHMTATYARALAPFLDAEAPFVRLDAVSTPSG